MDDFDRSFLMSRISSPGGSMQQLIDMAFEGNTNDVQPFIAPVEEAKTAALLNVYDTVTDPTATMFPPKGMLIPATMHEGKILTGRLGKTHYDMQGVESRAIVKAGETAPAGFLDELGNYMGRKDATAWLKANQPEVYSRLDNHSRTVGLESQGYSHAAGIESEESDLMEEFMKEHFKL